MKRADEELSKEHVYKIQASKKKGKRFLESYKLKVTTPPTAKMKGY